ncbi:MAG: hypothetical protein R3F17_13320 [Planctomycetota bacterium]
MFWWSVNQQFASSSQGISEEFPQEDGLIAALEMTFELPPGEWRMKVEGDAYETQELVFEADAFDPSRNDWLVWLKPR